MFEKSDMDFKASSATVCVIALNIDKKNPEFYDVLYFSKVDQFY